MAFRHYGRNGDGREERFVSSTGTARDTGVHAADGTTAVTRRGSGGCHTRVVEPCTFWERAVFVVDDSNSSCLMGTTPTIECEEYERQDGSSCNSTERYTSNFLR